MTRTSATALLSLAAILAIGQSLLAQATRPSAPPAAGAAPAAKAADVPVTRVVLFSSGVGYFEHNGSVNGTVTADLRFETAQINDVLKSLVVYDRSGGHVNTITYPANDPVNRTLRSFEVNLSGDPPLAEILKQIRGAQVTVNVADETVTGLILGVEQKEKPVGKGDAEKVIHTWVVNIITETGIRSVSLDDIRKLDIQDDKIKKEMNQALAALVQARDQSKKTVTVHFDGQGQRTVGMGYLVETPIWKNTYRLLLPESASKNNAELQAWAIVENQTDNDWNDVALSLVGGRPISFIEMLYQPIYVSRPVVQPTIIGSIIPQTYDNGISLGAGNLAVQKAQSDNLRQMLDGNGLNDNRRFSNAGAFNGNFDVTSNSMQAAANPAPAGVLPMTDFAQGVAAIAEAVKIGEMFHYTVDKVSLPRQQSSMIPIIVEGMNVDRLSIYSPSVSTKYAMRGLRLHNNSGKYLLAGPVTVMDTLKEGHSYAGDAKIEDIPPGQSRLLSYAVDQDTVIQIARDSGEESLMTGSILKGTFKIQWRSEIKREYTLQNKSDAPKTLILEHPFNSDYTLKEPAKSVEKTDKAYRFEVKLDPKESKTFTVTMERVRKEEMVLLNAPAVNANDPVIYYSRQDKIPPKVQEVLKTVAGKRAAIADLERKLQLRNADRTQITQDLASIRESIKVIPTGSTLDTYIKKLTDHDNDLTKANGDIKELQGSIEAARTDLTKYLETATVE